jgi:integrase/recombinase XerD
VGITKPSQLKKNTLNHFQIWLAETKNKAGKFNSVVSQNGTMKGARVFCDYLFNEDLVKENLTKTARYAREPRRLPQALTPYEVKRLLDAPDKTTAIGYRDRTIMEVFYSGAFRRGELADLTLDNVDLDNRRIYVRESKYLKDRTVPIGKIAVRYLMHYIRTVRPLMVKDPAENHVFISARGGRLSDPMFYIRMKTYGKQVGMKRRVYAHLWRSTCLTDLARNNMHIRYLQELAGHNNMTTTQRYIAVSDDDLKKAVAKCHPRERGEI